MKLAVELSRVRKLTGKAVKVLLLFSSSSHLSSCYFRSCAAKTQVKAEGEEVHLCSPRCNTCAGNLGGLCCGPEASHGPSTWGGSNSTALLKRPKVQRLESAHWCQGSREI